MAAPTGNQGLGALGMAAARLTLKVALQTAASNPRIVGHVARRMAENEGVAAFDKLSAGDRAVWNERARSAVGALVETVAL